MCATHKEPAAKLFEPAGQFGVACPSGMERVVHRTRRVVAEATSPKYEEALSPALEHEHIVHEDPDFVILKVELKNAFNKVSRFHMLRLVIEQSRLARWVHWCYASG